jgi:hypothetical protein
MRILFVVAATFVCAPELGWSDEFTVREDTGSEVTIEARLHGQGRGVMLLERRDGRLEFVPQEQILKRKPGPDPDPLTCQELIGRLTDQFGERTFRAC